MKTPWSDDAIIGSMDIQLSDQDITHSTIFFGALGLLLLALLLVFYKNGSFQASTKAISAASALFWGVLATISLLAAWGLYYQYLYPGWMRWLAPLDILLYGAIGLGMWALAVRLPGSAALWFVLLGGLEGVLEHVLGLYGLGILDKVPWLQGVRPGPVLVFSFFEYLLYWDLVAWLGLLLRQWSIFQ